MRRRCFGDGSLEIESFRFEDEDDCARELAGKRDSRRHSATGFVAATSYQNKCEKFYHFAIGRGLNLLQYK